MLRRVRSFGSKNGKVQERQQEQVGKRKQEDPPSESAERSEGAEVEEEEAPVSVPRVLISADRGMAQQRMRPTLQRRKSVSLDSVPLHVTLQKNQLFLKQRDKLQEDEETASEDDEGMVGGGRGGKLEEEAATIKEVVRQKKRVSASWDNLASLWGLRSSSRRRKREELREEEVELRNPARPRDDRKNSLRIRTMDVYDELIKSVEGLHENAQENKNKPANFPVNPSEDRRETPPPPPASTRVATTAEQKWPKAEAEVEVRKRATPSRPVRSKTFNFDTSKHVIRRRPDFEAKGPFKIQIGNEICAKLRSSEKLKISNGQLQVINGGNLRTLKFNVDLKPGARLITKKDVEMKDGDNTTYLFQFDSTKEARNFADAQKNRLSPLGEKITIKTKLLRLLGKRSSRDLLESKGILRNEPIFGNTLSDIYEASRGIPPFITRIIDLIESPCNIVSVGLYRASGNLAVIQKIRFEVDCGKLEILDEYGKDVDVLTGSLKLFFRELKEQLVPFDVCQKLLEVMDGPNHAVRTDSVLEALPEANREILRFLLKHLVKVCDYKHENKMDLYNMSVCWGPCLIGIPDSCTDIVMQAVNVSKVMEFLLKHQQASQRDANAPKPNPSEGDSFHNITHEVVQKLVEIIEPNITIEGVYKKSAPGAKIDKILKKLEKNKSNELDKSSGEVHDVCGALKKFVATLSDPLVPMHLFEQYCTDSDSTSDFLLLLHNLRQNLERVPKRETLVLLLRHLRKVAAHEKENKVTLQSILGVWTPILMPPSLIQSKANIETFSRFLEMLLRICEEYQDLPDLVQEQGRGMRESRYDNIPDIGDVKGEANLLEDVDKTETKF